jgi:hypothetical protein
MKVRDVRSQENRVLECMHVFHEECIDKWFESTRQKRCPICCHEERARFQGLLVGSRMLLQEDQRLHSRLLMLSLGDHQIVLILEMSHFQDKLIMVIVVIRILLQLHHQEQVGIPL